MAIYYTDKKEDDIRGWLIELQEIIPDQFVAERNRARELVRLLDEHPTHWASLIAYEYGRLRNVWRRLERQAASPPSISEPPNKPEPNRE